jgi:AraC family transcriptional regulator, transcriptional activator FtrA
VRRARELLESTDEALRDIAERSGLGTEANLRHHFTRLVGVSPGQYRRTFGRQPMLPTGSAETDLPAGREAP